MEILWSQQSSYPILAVLQLLPLLGMAWVRLMRKSKLLVPGVFVVVVAELFVAIHLYHMFDQSNAMFQFAEHLPIVGPLAYHAAVDGIAVLFVLLTALLGGIVVHLGSHFGPGLS